MSVPVAPVLRAFHIGGGTVRLYWRAVPGATSYNLYRGVPGSAPSLLASGVTSPKTQTGSTNKPYDFELKAVNGSGSSAPSNRVRVQTTAPADPDTDPTPGMKNAVRTGLI